MASRIFITGFMGSGKTYWAKLWAEKTSLHWFDLDEQVETTVRETVAQIFEKKGEEYFREIERYVLRKFSQRENFILACGGGTPCFFDNLQWMNEQGITIYLQSTANEILRRIINETPGRPLLKKLNQSELLFFIQQKLAEREPFYKQAKHILNTDELTIDSISEILNAAERTSLDKGNG